MRDQLVGPAHETAGPQLEDFSAVEAVAAAVAVHNQAPQEPRPDDSTEASVHSAKRPQLLNPEQERVIGTLATDQVLGSVMRKGFFIRTRGNPHDNDDMRQVLLEKFVSKIPADDPGRLLNRRYLYRTARNIAIDEYRKEQRVGHHERVSDPDDLPEVTTIDQGFAAVDFMEGPVVAAIQQLSPEHRRALLGVTLHGKSTTELGIEEGVPAGTIKSRHFYAIRAMRAALQSYRDHHTSL